MEIAEHDVDVKPDPSCIFQLQNGSNGTDIRQFHVLDEIGNESESNGSESYDSDIPDDEVDRMLEEALIKKKRNADEAGLGTATLLLSICSCFTVVFLADEPSEDKLFEERDKTVLINKGHNHFDILPEGWIQVTHNSGMPLYLHKTTRVCTLSKPYFLGPGSVRVRLLLFTLSTCFPLSKKTLIFH